MSSIRAAVQVGRQKLGLSDDAYRCMLQRITGCASSKQCTSGQLVLVLEEMRRKGFKSGGKNGRRPRVAISRKDILSKVEALLKDADRPWAYAESMAKHMFKRDRVDWLTTDELTALMQALIIDQKRRKTRNGA